MSRHHPTPDDRDRLSFLARLMEHMDAAGNVTQPDAANAGFFTLDTQGRAFYVGVGQLSTSDPMYGRLSTRRETQSDT